MRRMKPSYRTYKTYMAYTTYKTNKAGMRNAEIFANLMITLCFKQGYLLDQLINAIKKRFLREGGFREKLFKERVTFRQKSGKIDR